MVISSPCLTDIKNWLVQKQTAFGKDFSNPFTADSLLKTIWFSTHHASHAPCYSNEALAIPEQTATGKEISNPFMAGEDCWVLEDFTTYCCWFNNGAASEDLVLLRKIEENKLRSEDDIPPPPQTQTPTQQAPHTVSTIKLPILKKGEYDIWAMKMEHYLAHTDYLIWEVIQRGNVLPPTTQEEQFADEKERKARTLLLMAVPKDHLRRFHGMDDAKEIWAAIKTRKVECFNCHNYWALLLREWQVKVQRKVAAGKQIHIMLFKLSMMNCNLNLVTKKLTLVCPIRIAVKKLESQLKASHKQQSSLTEKLNFQANQIFEKDEKLKKYRRIGMKAVKDKDALQKNFDSWSASSKNLWKLIDCGMSSTVKIGLGYGIKSNAEVLGYEEEISRGIFAFRETNAGYNDIPLYSRFKQVEYKGVPHPLSGDYTPREQEDIDDSLYEYGKYGPQPQSPSPIESDASSTVSSTCQSNDSDGEQGTVSDHSVNDDPIPIPSSEQVTTSTQKTQPQVPKPQQTVDPSCAQHVKTPRQPIRTPVTPSPIPSYNRQNWNQRMERELGAGYSFERKPCFVCGSLSHLIKDCDYYEKKMAREAAFKSTRVVHANVRQATPAWTNSNRVNKANQFTPRPVQLNNIRPNLSTASNTIKTGRVNVNTGHGNVSSVSSGTQFKSGASRFNTGKQHVNSGSVHVNSGSHFKSGASRFNTDKQHVSSVRVNRPVSNNTSPKPSQVNLNSPKKCFSTQRSPVYRPFSRHTAYKSNIYAVKGKVGTAVKTSAGCDWRKTTPLSNTNSGPTPDSNVNVSRGPQGRPKPVKAWGPSCRLIKNCPKLGFCSFGGSKVVITVKSKAFRVYNLVTKRVEENRSVNFLEEKPNVQGIGHRFKGSIDIDVQTEEAAELMVITSTSQTEATRKAVSFLKRLPTKKHSLPKAPSFYTISKSQMDIITLKKSWMLLL
ncbi:hypothetical protein Tco_0727298 [Tanacetum coccineum]|uniref:Uncharacterized protein n=1 Tax=Tanacetum coccineum TaxID=301880 RepID=A0ABQ4YIU1_9ASTR